MATRKLILSMEGITKVYGSGERAVTALANVNLQASAGEAVRGRAEADLSLHVGRPF